MPLPMNTVSAGLSVRPYRTPTLPPATHTNTSFVGREALWVVDPATPYEAERDALLADVEAFAAAGRRPVGIVLTHHHVDHVGGAVWLSEQTGLPIWAHALTRDLLHGRVQIDHLVDDGDVIRGSDAVDDAWQVLFTPGHAPGHIVLWEPVSRVLIGGDMVAGVGTILVAPPDGHMATYIAQLRRLEALDPTQLVPAHGQVLDDPCAVLAHYVKHRLAREEKVAAALDATPQTLMAVTRTSYSDVPPALHPLAKGSALAHLIKLAEDGRATRDADGDRWSAA